MKRYYQTLVVVALCIATPMLAASGPANILPGSKSPDGSRVLTYERSLTPEPHLAFYVTSSTGSRLSVDLNVYDENTHASLIFDGIANCLGGDQKECFGFEYSVVWDTRSDAFVVEGSQHNWFFVAVISDGSTFRVLPTPKNWVTYYRGHSSGACSKSRKLHSDGRMVFPIEPGLFAIPAYPFVQAEDSVEPCDLYFLVEMRAPSGPKVVGLGRD